MSKSAMHFEIALVEAIHEALLAGAELVVPGLGTFSIDHRPATIQAATRGAEHSGVSQDNGSDEVFSTIIQPPENRISFVAASDDDNFPEFKTR